MHGIINPPANQANIFRRCSPEITVNSKYIRYDNKTCIFSDNRAKSLHGTYHIYLDNGEELRGEFSSGKLKNGAITKGTRELNITVDDKTEIATVEEKSSFGRLSYQFKLENINGTTTYILPKQNSKDCIIETTIYAIEFGYFLPGNKGVLLNGATVVVKKYFTASNTVLYMSGPYSGLPNKPLGRSLNLLQVYVGETIALRAARGYPITINDSGEIVGYCRVDTINPECLITEKFLFESGGLFAHVVVCVSEQFVDSKYHYLLYISAIKDNCHKFFNFIFYYDPNNVEELKQYNKHPELLYKRIDNCGKIVDGMLEDCGHISSMITLARLQHLATNAVRLYLKLLEIPVLSNEERFYVLAKIGDCYVKDGKGSLHDFKRAVDYYERALDIADGSNEETIVCILVNVGTCYKIGDTSLAIDLKRVENYYCKFTKIWNKIDDEKKLTVMSRYCKDLNVSQPIFLCCHELQLQARHILAKGTLPDLIKKMMNIIYTRVNIKILERAKVKYKDLPDIIRNHNYQCPLSLTQFNQEPEYDLQELEVIICAEPSGHITIYEYDAFCDSIKTARNEHPGMLKSIMFFVEPMFVQENKVGTPIYLIDFNNPTSEKIFWWYFK